jgi:PKD domain-containing protein
MHIGGRRGIEALAVLLAVLMIVGVLLPLTVRAASQVTGAVVQCGGPALPVSGATVSLIDVNGIAPLKTATTNGAGVYVFGQPLPPASYTVAAERSGYYSSQASAPVRFDGTQTVTMPTVCLYQHGSPSSILRVTVVNGPSNPVPGASVSAYQATNPTGRIQLVTKGTTGSTGVVNLTVWDASFELRTSAAGLPTVESTVVVTGTTPFTVDLNSVPVDLYGQVKDANGFLESGVVAWLYDPTAPVTSISRLIPGTVRDSYYQFEETRVPNGIPYTLIIDADGYLSSKESITLTGAPTQHDVILQPAPRERYETLILYGTADWNNLTSWRNLTLNADSTLTGLGPTDLRDLRLQIDATLGNGDGALDLGEIPLFEAWLVAKGPAYVTTDGFLTTNGKSYNSTLSSFSLTVSPTLSTPNARVWINATVQYKVKGAPPFITAGAKTYAVTMTVVPDSGVPSYKDNVYLVQLPRFYEMNNSVTKIIPSNAPVAATNFTLFTVDPGVMPAGSDFPQAQLEVERSLVGTARAKVIAPSGKFHEANTDFKNYQAFVANNTEITYSAESSISPIQPVLSLNFTWKFTGSDTRWNVTTKYKFTENGEKKVNLTMRDGGGNLSYRDFTVFVDDTLPLAQIRTNRTGTGSANGVTLRVDEGIPIRFDGGLSTDLAYPGKNGVILNPGYAWDFDGNGTVDATGRNVTHTFDKPGVFRVNLTVTDSVGWKGTNATMTAQVNDTKAPVANFEILDPEKDWAVITTPTEKKTIALNASKTRDNFDNLANLSFNWTIPGPISQGGTPLQGASHTFPGVNVSFAWEDWNQSYKVVLSVHDTGFRGTGPGAGSRQPNWVNLTRNVTVPAELPLHADLKVDALKISPPEGPEEGAPLTVSVNVTNKAFAGRITAQEVIVELFVVTAGVTSRAPVDSVQWFKGGAPTMDTTIPAGTTVTLVLTTHLTGQGNKTLRVFVYDSTEPYTWLSDNRPQQPLNVRQPWWQPIAIVVAVVAIIVLAVFGMYARRKIKAGEWRPIRGRRVERRPEEKEKPRREVKEEKRRL